MPTRAWSGIVLWLLVLTLSACTGGDPAAPPAVPVAGLVAPDGSPVDVLVPEQPSGATRDATAYGADPEPDTGDDAPAIREALAAAEPGDEVLLPAGVYDLASTDPDDDEANLLLADGVFLTGAGPGATVLRTSFDGEEDSAVVRGSGLEEAAITDLTITSEYDGPLGVDPDDEGPGGGPMFGVQIGPGSRRVLVADIAVEHFERHGITVKGSQEVTVTGCRVSDATSVGPGGSGYGIVIEGMAGQRDPDATDDSRYNVVVGNHLDGTHLRHGVLLQFPTHNNLIAANTVDGGVLDAIDLHGEGEYLNEIRGNTVTGADAAAIALGNSGGAEHLHDASGEGNWVHENRLVGNDRGVLVILGTPDTLIEANQVIGHAGDAVGVELRNAPGTVVRDNAVSGADEGFWAILLDADDGVDGRGAGVPTDVSITGNELTGAANGIDIAAGRDIDVTGNRLDVEGTGLRVAPAAEVERRRSSR